MGSEGPGGGGNGKERSELNFWHKLECCQARARGERQAETWAPARACAPGGDDDTPARASLAPPPPPPPLRSVHYIIGTENISILDNRRASRNKAARAFWERARTPRPWRNASFFRLGPEDPPISAIARIEAAGEARGGAEMQAETYLTSRPGYREYSAPRNIYGVWMGYF